MDVSPHQPIVVTGAAGFVGQHLLRRLADYPGRVVAIGRSAAPAEAGPCEWVRADLLQPSQYASAIPAGSVVMHLAATTGKASVAQYRQNNVDATERLLDACRKAGVARFVLASTIAATYTSRSHYHYAETKIAAEALVRRSGIPYTIVRPTLVFGAGSKVEEGLQRLACLPLIPMFGGGQNAVQPVAVEDLVGVLVEVARDGTAVDGVVEVGGPNTMTLERLLSDLRKAGGRPGPARFLRLPLGPTRTVLAVLERPLLSALPLTAGQLALFANDAVAEPHPLVRRALGTGRA
jgi:NADH dehydrogenase